MTFVPRKKDLTMAERQLAAFSIKETPLERFDNATRKAQLGQQNILMVFAKAADATTEELYAMTGHRQQLLGIMDNFRPMWIATDAERLPAAHILAKKFGLDVQAGTEPLLAIADERGELRAVKKAKELQTEGKLDADLVRQFLEGGAPKRLDAERLLADALAQAKKENKRSLHPRDGNLVHALLGAVALPR